MSENDSNRTRKSTISPDEYAGDVLVLLQGLPQRRVLPAPRGAQVGALPAQHLYHLRQLLLHAQFQGRLAESRTERKRQIQLLGPPYMTFTKCWHFSPSVCKICVLFHHKFGVFCNCACRRPISKPPNVMSREADIGKQWRIVANLMCEDNFSAGKLASSRYPLRCSGGKWRRRCHRPGWHCGVE